MKILLIVIAVFFGIATIVSAKKEKNKTAILSGIFAVLTFICSFIPSKPADEPTNPKDVVATVSTSTKAPLPDIGNTLDFGEYEGKALKWTVLDQNVNASSILLLATDIIRLDKYANEFKDTSWENCYLREWLNGEFYDSFSDSEKLRIAHTTIDNDNNQWYNTPGGNLTTDYFFLLSISEVIKYFGNSDAINQIEANDENGIVYQCYNNGFLGAGKGWKNISVPDLTKSCRFTDEFGEKRIAAYKDVATDWWLRSPGQDQCYAIDIKQDGVVNMAGNDVSQQPKGVRPAFWLIWKWIACLERRPTMKYNCFSYAWYRQTNSQYFIDYDQEFASTNYVDITNDTSKIIPGKTRVNYSEKGKVTHSAILITVDKKNVEKSIVRSKWGAHGLFEHSLNHCPYYGISAIGAKYKLFNPT